MANINVGTLITDLILDNKQFVKGLQDSAKKAAAFGDAVTKKTTSSVNRLAESLKRIATVSGGFKLALSGVKQVAGGVAQTFKGVGGALKLFGAFLVTRVPLIGKFAGGIKNLAGGLKRLPGNLARTAKGMAAIAVNVLGATRAGRALRSAFGKIGKGLSAVGAKAKAFGARLAAPFVSFGKKVAGVVRRVRNFGARVGSSIGKVAASIGRTLGPALKGVGKILGGVGKIGVGLGGALVGAFAKVGGAIGRTIGRVAKFGGAIAKGVGGAVLKGVGKLGGMIAKGIGGAVSFAIPKLQSLGNILLTTVKGGALAAGAAIVGMGAALIKTVFDAAPIKGIQDAFAGLAKASGTGMKEMLGALQQGSAGMITNRDLMTSFNKAASLVSVDFAKRLPDAMNVLGKVSAATGEDMGFLLNSLVTGVGRLSPMILDNLGIQVDLASANEDYAKSLGVSVGSLSKTQQQTALTNQVFEKLALTTAAMPDVAGSATAGLAQFGTMIKNTGAAIGLALLPALEKILPPILELATGVIDKVLPAFEKIGGALGTFIEGILAGADPLAALKVALFNAFGIEGLNAANTIEDIVLNIQNFITRVQALITEIQPYIDKAAAFITENVNINDAFIALGITLATVIIPAILAMAAPFLGIIATFLLLIAGIALLRTAWENNFLGIREAVTAFIANIQEGFPAFMENLQAGWRAFTTFLSTAWANMVTAIQAISGTFTLALEGEWAQLGANLRAGAEAAWTAIKAAFDAGVAALKAIDWGALGKAVIDGIVKGIKSGVGALKDAVKNAARAALEAAKGFLKAGSPSLLFAEQIGKPMMTGTALGIMQNASVPGAAMVQSTRNIVNETTQEFNMTVNTQATTPTVIQDFTTMQALAGAS